jgi:Flp pilus assembly protein TadD/outer membrane protein OmpA-like peptidoglycan-associated protein
MKNSKLKSSLFILTVGVALTGCDGLGKMVKNASLVTTTLTPNPLEMHGDSITVNINGKFPAKFFDKKASVEATPVLKYNGQELSLKPKKYKGESAEGDGTVINYNNGGSISYKDKFAYQPGMEDAVLVYRAKGSRGSKSKEFPEVKLGEGTIITPLMVQNDARPDMAKDKFTKVVPKNISGDILFLIQSDAIRPTELKEPDMVKINEFIKAGTSKLTYKSIDIASYASPDGEERINEGLSLRRGQNTSKELKDQFKKHKVKIDDKLFNVKNTPEDWEGFKTLVSQSNIKDKELILRVLGMYSDSQQREQEMKNMAKTWDELSNDILPKLRRSQFTLNAEIQSRTDAQISGLVKTNPDSLNVEEMLYAATLTNDQNEKLTIYKKAAEKYNDWRAHNNVGYILLTQNKLNEAKATFEKAAALSNDPIVTNNLGIIAYNEGDLKKAAEMFGKSNTNNAKYNMSMIQIKRGDYASAVSGSSGVDSFNSALAKLLNGSADAALKTIDASSDKDSALGYYLKAVAGARQGNVNLIINNLKSAVAKDASLKAKAKKDKEFAKYVDNAEFSAVVN